MSGWVIGSPLFKNLPAASCRHSRFFARNFINRKRPVGNPSCDEPRKRPGPRPAAGGTSHKSSALPHKSQRFHSARGVSCKDTPGRIYNPDDSTRRSSRKSVPPFLIGGRREDSCWMCLRRALTPGRRHARRAPVAVFHGMFCRQKISCWSTPSCEEPRPPCGPKTTGTPRPSSPRPFGDVPE